MNFTLWNSDTWKSIGVAWTWGMCSYLRNHSVRKMTYQDAMRDSNHRPDSVGLGTGKIVDLVLCHGDIHKE
eukprot:9739586-Ditylum_brightwellii.AAC.1